MSDLIARLEKATGPDRQLDLAIHTAIFGQPSEDNLDELLAPEAYTGSIDSAVTLVPESWAWFVEWIGDPFTEGHARLWIPIKRTRNLPIESVDVQRAATPALALCIAAMKARTVMKDAK